MEARYFDFVSPAEQPEPELEQAPLNLGAVTDPRRLLPVIYSLPLLNTLMAEVARDHCMTVEEINRDTRARRSAWARQDFMFRAYMVIRADGTHRYSLPRIGMYFQGRGGRELPLDHTTVLHGVRQEIKRRRLKLLARIKRENEASARLHGTARIQLVVAA